MVNVWFIIWPAQKKVIPAVRDGVAPDARLLKRAVLASKTNTYLSGPMLFGMAGAEPLRRHQYTHGRTGDRLGLFAIWWSYKSAPKVGKSI